MRCHINKCSVGRFRLRLLHFFTCSLPFSVTEEHFMSPLVCVSVRRTFHDAVTTLTLQHIVTTVLPLVSLDPILS